MNRSLVLLLFLLLSLPSLFAADTLYFKLSNPWNTVKDANGTYLRKAVITDSAIVTLDYNTRGILVAAGFYTDTNFNRKLYCHTYFYENSGIREEIRCYQNGRLNGKRWGFDEKGDTAWVETYQENTLLKTEYLNNQKRTGEVDLSTFSQSIPAAFPGGIKAWIAYLSNNLVYPRKAVKAKIEGTVKVQFQINKEGKVVEAKIIQSVHPLLDEEALRLITNSPAWTPAIQNGKVVIFTSQQPITFKL